MMQEKRHSINLMPGLGPTSHEEGQTLIEFLFLMIIMITLGFGMLYAFNNGIADQWKALVTLIARPTPSAIEF